MSQGDKSRYLVIAAAILSAALVICAFVLAKPLENYAKSKSSITVTGSAKKQIKSDLVVWRGSFYREAEQLDVAYKDLKADLETVKAYLVDKGIPEKDIVVSSINTSPQYIYNKYGNTGEISGYRLSQEIEVESKDVDKLTAIARESTELIEQGILFESYPPEYFYTKLNDLKIDMLAEATKDAKKRAEKMAESTGSKIGHLRSARMGVFQITPVHSNEVSSLGINDTTSLMKEITAVANVEFSLE
ncbi:hypothetical protein JOC37_000300 [Desulfohalotomaculum tongense]|uniref:SIMPL domain-containing protein n=1 Tax=Desulforadius tongensis TaxID=1216062 RepID=UPI001957B3C8|nr:SIMPL domain-containing protein [Desulforadius tongensis]MBM7853935.1 hypothetical protein [Desulforadius tongensis]